MILCLNAQLPLFGIFNNLPSYFHFGMCIHLFIHYIHIYLTQVNDLYCGRPTCLILYFPRNIHYDLNYINIFVGFGLLKEYKEKMFSKQYQNIRHPGILFFCLFVYLFLLFRAIPMAYGGSQARDQIGAMAANLHHSYRITGSEPHLRPTPQLTTTQDLQPTE